MTDAYPIAPDAKLTTDEINAADHQRRGIGSTLARMAIDRCAARRIVALVSTPAARPFFEALGFVTEAHGHTAMYLRPHAAAVPPIR